MMGNGHGKLLYLVFAIPLGLTMVVGAIALSGALQYYGTKNHVAEEVRKNPNYFAAREAELIELDTRYNELERMKSWAHSSVVPALECAQINTLYKIARIREEFIITGRRYVNPTATSIAEKAWPIVDKDERQGQKRKEQWCYR